MLPKEQKLTRRTFPKHNDPKKIWTGSYLRIHYSFVSDTKRPLFAAVTPKKTFVLAVKRNYFKRIVHDAIQTKMINKKNFGGMKVVIFPQKKDLIFSRTSIEKDISNFASSLHEIHQ